MDMELAGKFEKIMTLMDKAATEGEAQAAAAAFQRLLLKHGVEEMEVRRAAGTVLKGEQYTYRWITVAPPRSKDTGWTNSLMHTLARYSLCRSFNRGSGKQNTVCLLGLPSEIAALVQFFDRTSAAFARLALASVEEMQREARSYGEKPAHAGSWRNSFLLGAVSGLDDKLRAEREALQQEEGVTALVVVRDKELDAATRNFFGRVGTQSNKTRYSDAEAYSQGYQTGRNYQDGKELGAGRTALHA